MAKNKYAAGSDSDTDSTAIAVLSEQQTDEIAVEVLEETVAEESVAEQQVESNTSQKIGVYQFLRKHPQDEGIQDLVQTLYEKSIMTEDEWLVEIQELLSKKSK